MVHLCEEEWGIIRDEIIQKNNPSSTLLAVTNIVSLSL